MLVLVPASQYFVVDSVSDDDVKTLAVLLKSKHVLSCFQTIKDVFFVHVFLKFCQNILQPSAFATNESMSGLVWHWHTTNIFILIGYKKGMLCTNFV